MRYSTYVADYNSSWTTTTGKTTTYRNENSDSASTITYGVNWLLNPNAAIKVNYSVTDFGRPVAILSNTNSATDDTEKVISIRTQVNW